MTTVQDATNITSISGNAPQKSPRKRIEPLKAWRAIKALIADKEDTGQVFKVIDALSGNADDRMYNRFMATETGQRVVAEKRDLITLLNDRERLKHLPEGTLGRSYYEFMAEENLTADGLVEASNEAPRRNDRPESAMIFGDRMRDSHDLWHVTTSYGRDGLGELSQLAFYYAQTRNRGIGFIVLMGAHVANKEAPKVGVWRAVREGYRLGKKAKWFPAADWEALLEKPLEEVRATLGMGVPATYREIEPITSGLEGKIYGEEKKAA
ncbi:MAG TPA: Coq4 family protein [Parvibaculum sp.]|jgi:ubiquinone biosynthesis protein COQ4